MAESFNRIPRTPQGPSSLLAEYWNFVKYTGKWWLVPVLAIILMLGALVFLSGTGAAPFIYTLF
jgi:hypothetical protein